MRRKEAIASGCECLVIEYPAIQIAATQAKPASAGFMKGNLKRMAQTIETASKTVESGKTLWGNIKPVLKELPVYFGVAASFFGL